MISSKSVAVGVACAVAATSAMAEDAKRAELRVKVVQQVTVANSKPFSNISGFLLQRVKQPYQGGRCYEPTDQQGLLSCRFVCLPADESAVVNLVPPRTLDGYADSGEVQLQLRGCTLSKQEVTVVYRDAAMAIQELLKGEQLASQFAAIGTSGWQPVPFDTVRGQMSALAATPEGRQKLGEIRVLTNVLAGSKQYTGNAAASAALSSLSTGAANVLLGKAAEIYVDPDTQRKMFISPHKNDYFKNLDTLEFKLQTKPNKSRADLDALRGIDELKEQGGSMALKNNPFLLGAPKKY
jgi:hypothetical protein